MRRQVAPPESRNTHLDPDRERVELTRGPRRDALGSDLEPDFALLVGDVRRQPEEAVDVLLDDLHGVCVTRSPVDVHNGDVGDLHSLLSAFHNTRIKVSISVAACASQDGGVQRDVVGWNAGSVDLQQCWGMGSACCCYWNG